MPSEAAALGRWMVGAALVAALVSVPAGAVRSTYGAQAAVDEPHYLLTAISLAEDGDLDVGDELDDERWRAFHEAEIPQQAQPRPDGSRVSPHDPLLPALLAVPYELGGLTGARMAMALLNGALAAALVHLLVRRLHVGARLATATAAVAGASVPFVVYGAQIYPEIPAALAVTVAVDAALGTPSVRRTSLVWLAVVSLPWLSVKYAPAAAAIAGVHLWGLWRGGHQRLLGVVVGAYAVAAGTYVWGHLAWYGGLTVYAAGDFFHEHGGQLAVVGTNPNPLGRTRRLVGLLVDRQFGIAAWQPAWLAVVPALGAWFARRSPGTVGALLALPLLAGWLNATYVAVTMHGYWFPGRQIVHVLPLAAALVAWWLNEREVASGAARPERGLGATVVVGLLAAFGLWSTVALLVDGVAGQLTWVVDFATVDHAGYRLWAEALPDHLNRPEGTTWRTVAWGLALPAAGVLGWWTARRRASDQR